MRTITALAAIAGLTLAASSASAEGVIRYQKPGSTFPIAQAVEVPAGMSTVYLSGTASPGINADGKPVAKGSFGDTEAQTRGTLTNIRDTLGSMHLSMSDVVKMHIYMVADPKTGNLDFAGMMRAYKEFFGTKDQPNLPARSAFEVSHLAGPGLLVEIEVTAVRPAAH
ncbi:MAG: hypothetical protein GX413_08270 [Acetobacter sp.]|jgi:enamine deaminase RidA (YjgF/YER057c/UK114 family)|nr:hypothetical protein [Acetobacter sp.]